MDLTDLEPETLQLREELLQERSKAENLEQQIKQLERDYLNQIKEIKTALEAEKEKSNHLQSALQSRTKNESNKSDKENDRLDQLESENFKNLEKIKSLEAEMKDMQQNRLNLILSKDVKIRELEDKLDDVENEIQKYEEEVQTLSSQLLSTNRNTKDAQEVKNELMHTLKDREIELIKLKQDTQEILENALKDRERVIENYENEIAGLKEALEQNDSILDDKKKETKNLQERLKSNYEEMCILQEYVSEIEEKYKNSETENENLKKGIQNKEKTILNLEQEISTVAEDVKDSHNETIIDLQKRNSQLQMKISDLERRSQSTIKQKELLEESLKSEMSDLHRSIENLEKDKKQSLDSFSKLHEDNKKLQETIKQQESEFNQLKQDFQKEANCSIMRLKGEKLELDHQIQDLIRQLDLNRTSIRDEFSLQDELSQLEDFRGSRLSTPKNGAKDSKKIENIFKEMSEKDYALQNLQYDKDFLNKQLDSLTTQVYSLKKEIETQKSSSDYHINAELEIAKGEIIRLETQILKSRESWAEEINILRNLLSDTEQIAIQAKLKYAEAATDRDIYFKKFQDLSSEKPKERKSLARFFRRKSKVIV